MVPLLSRKLFLQKNLLQIGVRSNNLTVLIKEKGGEKRGKKKKKDTEIRINIVQAKKALLWNQWKLNSSDVGSGQICFSFMVLIIWQVSLSTVISVDQVLIHLLFFFMYVFILTLPAKGSIIYQVEIKVRSQGSTKIINRANTWPNCSLENYLQVPKYTNHQAGRS